MPSTVVELEKMLNEKGVTLTDCADGSTTWSITAIPAAAPVAVPGMPSAARDAALEEAAALADSLHATISDIWEERAEAGHNVLTNVASQIRARKSIAAPLASAIPMPKPSYTCSIMGAPDEEYFTVAQMRESYRLGMVRGQSTPAPVQQAAPSGWISVDERMPADETPVIILLDGKVHLGELRWDTPGWEDNYEAYLFWDDPNNDGQDWQMHDVTHWMPLPPAPGAAPAQPVGLSEQDKLDAARWCWMREHWFLFGTAHSITTTLGFNLHRVNIAGDVETLDAAVDAAILAAKEAP